MSNTANHIGKTIYVASAAPATNNDAGFVALTWVLVSGSITLPQLGVSHSMIDVPDLQTGFTSAVKGAAQGVDTTATFRDVATDAGQIAVTALGVSQDGIGSIKIVTGTGTDNAPVTGDAVSYAQGIIHSYQPNAADNSSFEGFTVGFRQNDFTIDATIPA
jgi:hypothetical protein